MSQGFVQIPLSDFDVLERLSENSLKLYLLLRKSLNRKTGQCNPSPESLGWEKSKYYRARKELELTGLVKFTEKQAAFVESCQFGELENLQLGESENSSLKVGESPTKQLENPQLAYKEEPEELNQKNITRGGSAHKRENNFRPPFAGIPATAESEQLEKQIGVALKWLIDHYRMPVTSNQALYESAAVTVAQSVAEGFEERALMDFFGQARAPVKLRFFAEDFSAWAASQKQMQRAA